MDLQLKNGVIETDSSSSSSSDDDRDGQPQNSDDEEKLRKKRKKRNKKVLDSDTSDDDEIDVPFQDSNQESRLSNNPYANMSRIVSQPQNEINTPVTPDRGSQHSS